MSKTVSPSTQAKPVGSVTVERALPFLHVKFVGSVYCGLAFAIVHVIFLTSLLPSLHLYPGSRVAFAICVPAFVAVLPVNV